MSQLSVTLVAILSVATVYSASIPEAIDIDAGLQKLRYNKYVPPFTGAVPVNIGFHVNNMAFNYQRGTLDINVYMRMGWFDERLKDLFTGYNVTDDFRLRLFKDQVNLIWMPDIFIKNSDKVEKIDALVPEVLMTVSKMGGVWYVPRLVKTLYCPDLQNGNRFVTCKVQFESYGYGKHQMELNWLRSPVKIDRTVTLQGHQLEDYNVGKCNENFTEGAYPCLEASFKWRRLPPRRVFEIGIYVTSILLLVISWLGFWTPPGDRRVFLGLGVALVLGILFLAVTEYQNFAYLEIVSSAHTWLVFCFAMDLGMILEYAFAHVLIRIIPATFKSLCCKCRLPEFKHMIFMNDDEMKMKTLSHSGGPFIRLRMNVKADHQDGTMFDKPVLPSDDEADESVAPEANRPTGIMRVGYMIDLISGIFIFPIALILFFFTFAGTFLAFQ